VLFEGDGQAFREWLEPYVKELGAEVLVSDDNDSYGVAAAGLGLERQLCVAHVRKYVTKRSNSILKQAKREWAKTDERLPELKRDLERVGRLVDELREGGARELRKLHLRYLWATCGRVPPIPAKKRAPATGRGCLRSSYGTSGISCFCT
jgi:hypothetical protein